MASAYFSLRLEFSFMFFRLKVGKLNLCGSEMRRERVPYSKVINGKNCCTFFLSTLVLAGAGYFVQICSEMEIAYTLLVPPSDQVHFKLASASQIGTIGSIEKLSNFFSQEKPVTLQQGGGKGCCIHRKGRSDVCRIVLFYRTSACLNI